jgi:hypothetical protein
VGLNLPVAFGNASGLEDNADSRRFAHEPEYDPFRLARKPQSGPPYSN